MQLSDGIYEVWMDLLKDCLIIVKNGLDQEWKESKDSSRGNAEIK